MFVKDVIFSLEKQKGNSVSYWATKNVSGFKNIKA